CSRTGPAQLDQVRAVRVAVAGCPFSIHADRPVARGEGCDGLGECGRVGDDGGQTVAGFDQENGWLAHRSGPPRGEGIATTPAGSGVRPAARVSTSPQARACRDKSGSSGVHEARISISAVGGSPAIAPNDSEAPRVTVPLAAV